MECPLNGEGLTEDVRNVLLNFTVGHVIEEPVDSEHYGLRFFEELNAFQDRRVLEEEEDSAGPEYESDSEFVRRACDFERRGGVCFQKEFVDRRRSLFSISAKERIRIRFFLQKIFPFKTLETRLLDEIIDGMVRVEVLAGDTVMRQGEEAQNFFMIESGAYEEWVISSGVGSLMFRYESLGCFGRASLIFPHVAPATVIARKNGELWALNCVEYRSLVAQHERLNLQLKRTCLDSLPFFSKLPQREKDKLVDAIERLRFAKNCWIINGSTRSNGLYYVISGNVQIKHKHEHIVMEETSKAAGPGENFGDLSMFCGRLNGTTAVALEESEILFLSASSFERLIGPFNRVAFPDDHAAPLVGYGRWDDSFKISLYRELETLIKEYRHQNEENILKFGLDYYKKQQKIKMQLVLCDGGSNQTQGMLCGEGCGENRVISSIPKTEISVEDVTYPLEDVHPRGSQVDRIQEILRTIPIFKALSEVKMGQMVRAMQLVTVYEGHYVVKSGKLGHYFYLVEEGRFRTVVNGDGVAHEILGCPDYFGELGLVMDVPRFADVVAVSKGYVWALSRDNFRKIADSAPTRRKSLNYKLVKNVRNLGSLKDYDVRSLSLSLENKTLKDREVVQSFQDDAVGMYFVKKGAIRVYSKTLKQNHTVARAGQNFGFLVFSIRKCDDVRAQSVGVSKVALLKIDAFEKLLAHCRKVLHQNKCLQSKYDRAPFNDRVVLGLFLVSRVP